MKLIVVVEQKKNGHTQYVEHQVSYMTALKMIFVDVIRRIKQQ